MSIRKSGGALPRRAVLQVGAALIAGLTLVSAEAAAAPRKYAAMSLLGGKITIVTQQSQTGSHLNRNQTEPLELPEGVFDIAALLAVTESVEKAEHGATVQALKLPNAKTFGDPAKLLDGDRFVAPEKLLSTLKQVDVSHLVLVTQHRAPAAIRMKEISVATRGQLEGLGFFIDRDTRVRDERNNEQTDGFLAPYAYIKLSLIDLASGKVERQQTVARGVALATDRAEGVGDPWQVMTTEQKIDTLRDMLQDEIRTAVPRLLAGK